MALKTPAAMPSELSPLDVFNAALAEYDALSEDVQRSDARTFKHNLQRLITFQRSNKFTQELFASLKISDYEGFIVAASASIGTSPGQATLEWPMDVSERLFLQTRLLTDFVDGKMELFPFLEDFYLQSGVFEANLPVFQEQLLRPYLRDYRRHLAALAPRPSIAATPGVPVGKIAGEYYDVFISHASEDKEDFVRPLAEELNRRGLRVWYDEFTIMIGDSLLRKIDEGLLKSQYGIVVLSRHFFEKRWPRAELEGLVSREMRGGKVILPVWHGVSENEVLEYSPILAAKMAADTEQGAEGVADEIMKVVRPGGRGRDNSAAATKRRQRSSTKPLSELLWTINRVAPLLYAVDEPLEGKRAQIFLGALQSFFCGNDILNSDIDARLRSGADNLLRVISSMDDRPGHLVYLVGKLNVAQKNLESFREQADFGYELANINAEGPLALNMKQMHAALLGALEKSQQVESADRLTLRLVIALLEYGTRQHDPASAFPSVSAGIHHSLRELLAYLLARKLNVALPDRLDNILTGDVKAYCHSAWEELEDFEYGPVRKALRILRHAFFQSMPWNRAKRIKTEDLVIS